MANELDNKLDLKDLKILFELDRNSRASLTSIAKKVRLSKEVVFHRINKLVREGYIQRFQAVLSTYRIGYQSYKLYFKLQNASGKDREEIQRFLLKNKAVWWIGNCQGQWDLIIGIWARSIQEFSLIEEEILNQLGNLFLEKDFSVSSRTVQFNRRWFYSDKSPIIETTFGEDLDKVEVDELDIKIIKQLSLNSRIKIIELSKKIKANINTIINRIKNLEKKGVILGYKISLDPKKMGYETCKAFIYLKNINEKRKKELINNIRSLKNSINIVQAAGKWDLEIEFEVKSFDEYYKIMGEMQEKFKDIIRRYDSVVLTSEPKQVFMAEI